MYMFVRNDVITGPESLNRNNSYGRGDKDNVGGVPPPRPYHSIQTTDSDGNKTGQSIDDRPDYQNEAPWLISRHEYEFKGTKSNTAQYFDRIIIVCADY